MEKVYLERKLGTIVMDKPDYIQAVQEGNFIGINANARGYLKAMICRKENGKLVFRTGLAKYLMGSPKWKHVDHIDQDSLNNCRVNLRLADHSQNGANRKPTRGKNAKGILKIRGRFIAAIHCKGIRYSAGAFDTELEAAKAYNELAVWLFGEFAGINDLKKLV